MRTQGFFWNFLKKSAYRGTFCEVYIVSSVKTGSYIVSKISVTKEAAVLPVKAHGLKRICHIAAIYGVHVAINHFY